MQQAINNIPYHAANIKSSSVFNIPQFINDTSVFIAENIEKYGDFFKVFMPVPGYHFFAVANPLVLQHLLVRNEDNYQKSKYFWRQLRAVAGKSIGTTEGEEWLLLKRLHMRFFNHKNAHSYLDEIADNNHHYFDIWEKKFHGKEVKIINIISELNTASLLKVLFGYKAKDQCEILANIIEDGQTYILWRSIYPWRSALALINGKEKHYDKNRKYFDAFAYSVYNNRKEKAEAIERLIDIIIEHADFDKNEDAVKNLRSEIIVYIGAGNETAAVGLGWAIYLLSTHPEALQKMRNEVNAVTKGERVQPKHITELTYTDMVIKETLRLYSPSHSIVRDAISDDYINDIKIPKGSTVFVSSYALHRNPYYWYKPNDFIPERFATEPEKYTYIPFGAGKHTCIGRYLATPFMIMMLAEFVMRFDFELVNKEPVVPISASTLKPKDTLWMFLKNRGSR